MGICVGLMFDEDLPEAQAEIDDEAKCIPRHIHELDEICVRLGLRPLSDHVDSSAYAISEEELEAIPEEYREAAAAEAGVFREEEIWAPSSEVLAACNGLLNVLRANQDLTNIDPESRDYLIECLDQFRKALEIGAKAGRSCQLFYY